MNLLYKIKNYYLYCVLIINIYYCKYIIILSIIIFFTIIYILLTYKGEM